MTNADILTILKLDLGMSASAYDSLLLNDIESARAAIAREGIALADSYEDGMLVEAYAAWLYRSRREDSPMPRNLRWRLNNRRFSSEDEPNG